jgi:molecular chaperone IbpA
MTFNKLPSIFKQLRPVSIGFDNIFDHFENFFDDDHDFHSSLTSTFPFYNIVKKGNNKFDIEVALAGYDKKDISVEYEDNVLHIKSIKEAKLNKEKEPPCLDGVIHQGIAKRLFSKSFTIADDVEIEGAELKNGLLKVSLHQIVPESKKPKQITVK